MVTVAFVQEYRSEKSLEELNKLVPPICRCIRNGNLETFLARLLVPGDIVTLETGDRVPADLRLLSSIELLIDESSFTGETEPVSKKDEIEFNNTNKSNIAFMGTLVCSGKGKGVVINTGSRSQFGKIFQLMQSEEAPKTPLQKSMDTLGKQLSLYSFFIIFLIMILGWIQGRAMMKMFNIGVSLAVAAIPEGLPIVVTVTLALGVMRMAKENAVIKRLPTVETLGCVNVICSDKTGTLTKNEMTITSLITSELFQAELTGVGYSSPGELKLLDFSESPDNQIKSIQEMLKVGCICNNANINDGRLFGQPTEGAIIVAARKLNLINIRDNYERFEEIPFSSTQKLMAVRAGLIKVNPSGSADYVAKYFVKGALEVLLAQCTKYKFLQETLELNDNRINQYKVYSQNLGRKGLRGNLCLNFFFLNLFWIIFLVLAFASGSSMKDLTFLGMVGILDPPKPGVQEAIMTLHSSGVEVKMLTGDSMETACAIGERLGLLGLNKMALSGDEMERLDDETFERLVSLVSIFYRVGPRHKLRIVKALQNCGLIVGMTGDGVNDGVALKKADIGIAMGQGGTDVCKEVSDMILVTDDFYTIMLAIEEGKTIFYNIRNFVRFQLST